MSGYTKLFSSILESTVWLESPPVKVVWITMLAMANRDGVVEASVPGLAKRAGVDRIYCEQALVLFMGPDPDSRTKDHEGRRIVEVPGGWRLLNHALHRERVSKAEALQQAAVRQRRHRDRKATALRDVTSNAAALRNVTSHIDTVTNNENNPIAPSYSDSDSRSSVKNTDDPAARDETPPLDVWLEQLQAAYPQQRVTFSYLTSSAFVEVFQTDPRRASEVWAELQANLANQKCGHEWRVKGMVPKLDKWLRDGLWKQVHDEHPPSTLVSEKTAGTLEAAAFILNKG